MPAGQSDIAVNITFIITMSLYPIGFQFLANWHDIDPKNVG